jgi:hypothetical protein
MGWVVVVEDAPPQSRQVVKAETWVNHLRLLVRPALMRSATQTLKGGTTMRNTLLAGVALALTMLAAPYAYAKAQTTAEQIAQWQTWNKECVKGNAEACERNKDVDYALRALNDCTRKGNGWICPQGKTKGKTSPKTPEPAPEPPLPQGLGRKL